MNHPARADAAKSTSPTPETRSRLARWWVGLVMATVLLCLLISLRYLAVAHVDDSFGALLFRTVMLIAHFAVLSALLLSPVLLIALAAPRPRLVIAMGTAVATLIVLALLIDTQVYQLYRFHINAGVLNLLFGGAARETFVFSAVMYAQAAAIAACVLCVVTVAGVLLWRACVRSRAPRLLARATASAVVLSIVSFHMVHIWADAVAYEPLLEQTALLPLRYAATAKRFLRAHGIEVSSKPALRPNRRPDTTALSYPLRPLSCSDRVERPNIVFILIDSWRFDAMNERVTPNIAAFARDATRFLDHHSGGNATRIGVFSLFYAIPGTYWHQMLNEQRGPVFIDELQHRRYEIQVLRSAPIYSPEFDRTVFANVSVPRRRSDGEGPADWDRDVTDDFLAFLAARSATASPFFAFLFYDSPHTFQLPADYPLEFRPSAPYVNYLRLDAETNPTPLVNRYRNSVRYVDGLIGHALDDMRARGLLDNTIIVITGDHGQEFNDTGKNYWGHGSNFTRYQTGVPLLLYVPGRPGGVVRHRTTHFDIAPTLLNDHLGCTSPLPTFTVGRSLYDSGERHPLVLSEYADFAIVERARITVVREQGMQIFAPDYSRLESPLDANVTRAALEQKTRFYKSAGRRLARSASATQGAGAAE